MNYSGCLDPVGRPTDGFRFARSPWCPAIFSRPSSSRSRRISLLASDQIKIAEIGCQLRRFVGDRTAPGLVSCAMYGNRRSLSLLHSCAARSAPINVDPPGRQVETLRVRVRSSLTATRNHIQLRCHKCSRCYMRPECTPGSLQKSESEVVRSRICGVSDDRHYLLQRIRKARICFYHKIEYLSLLCLSKLSPYRQYLYCYS